MLPPGGWWLEAGKLIPIAPAVCGPFLRGTRPGTAHLSVSRRAAAEGTSASRGRAWANRGSMAGEARYIAPSVCDTIIDVSWRIACFERWRRTQP